MQSYAIQSLATCVLGVAVMAGCATQPFPPAGAPLQGSIQSGQISSIETASAADQEAASSSGSSESPSSGGGAMGTAASGGPALITVQFADGTQGRFISEQHSPKSFSVGEPVNVITSGDRMTMASPRK